MARLEYTINYSNEGIECTYANVLEILNEVIYFHEAIDSIKLIIKGNIPKIYTNQQLLFIIINNLVENGIKYGLPERKVDVSIEVYKNCEKNGIKIAVVNDIGKAGRPDPSKIFEKYYRSPHARYSSGSGLGLYLARRFAELLKGELKLVDSDKVRFELWLPI
jgi:signal transduction histidine kinase